MTDEDLKKYWIECLVCHELFDMEWGTEHLNICDSCNGKKSEEMYEEQLGELAESAIAFGDQHLMYKHKDGTIVNLNLLREQIDILNAVVGYYANPDNWTKHSVTGYDGDGRAIEETFYRGDGGELARKHWLG